MATREQERAQMAYSKVSPRANGADEADYMRFAKSFPALIQSCGLAQALAFAQAKKHESYLNDLATVMKVGNSADLASRARDSALSEYQRYSREALAAATWLKRYAEALLKGDD